MCDADCRGPWPRAIPSRRRRDHGFANGTKMGNGFPGTRKNPVVVELALPAFLQEFEDFLTHRQSNGKHRNIGVSNIIMGTVQPFPQVVCFPSRVAKRARRESRCCQFARQGMIPPNLKGEHVLQLLRHPQLRRSEVLPEVRETHCKFKPTIDSSAASG